MKMSVFLRKLFLPLLVISMSCDNNDDATNVTVFSDEYSHETDTLVDAVSQGNLMRIALEKLCPRDNPGPECPAVPSYQLVGHTKLEIVPNVDTLAAMDPWLVNYVHPTEVHELSSLPAGVDEGSDHHYILNCRMSDGTDGLCFERLSQTNVSSLHTEPLDEDRLDEVELQIDGSDEKMKISYLVDGDEQFLVNRCFLVPKGGSHAFAGATIAEVTGDPGQFFTEVCEFSRNDVIFLTKKDADYASPLDRFTDTVMTVHRLEQGAEVLFLVGAAIELAGPLLLFGVEYLGYESALPYFKAAGQMLGFALDSGALVAAGYGLRNNLHRYSECSGQVCRDSVLMGIGMDAAFAVLGGASLYQRTAKIFRWYNMFDAADRFGDVSGLSLDATERKKFLLRLWGALSEDASAFCRGDGEWASLDLKQRQKILRAISEVDPSRFEYEDFWKTLQENLERARGGEDDGFQELMEFLSGDDDYPIIHCGRRELESGLEQRRLSTMKKMRHSWAVANSGNAPVSRDTPVGDVTISPKDLISYPFPDADRMREFIRENVNQEVANNFTQEYATNEVGRNATATWMEELYHTTISSMGGGAEYFRRFQIESKQYFAYFRVDAPHVGEMNKGFHVHQCVYSAQKNGSGYKLGNKLWTTLEGNVPHLAWVDEELAHMVGGGEDLRPLVRRVDVDRLTEIDANRERAAEALAKLEYNNPGMFSSGYEQEPVCLQEPVRRVEECSNLKESDNGGLWWSTSDGEFIFEKGCSYTSGDTQLAFENGQLKVTRGTYVLWKSDSMGWGQKAVFQGSDGNLVVYGNGKAIGTGTQAGPPHGRTVVLDDKGLSIKDTATGRTLWMNGEQNGERHLFAGALCPDDGPRWTKKQGSANHRQFLNGRVRITSATIDGNHVSAKVNLWGYTEKGYAGGTGYRTCKFKYWMNGLQMEGERIGNEVTLRIGSEDGTKFNWEKVEGDACTNINDPTDHREVLYNEGVRFDTLRLKIGTNGVVESAEIFEFDIAGNLDVTDNETMKTCRVSFDN